ncbi:CidA/LrgA family protein [[Pasteurella] aerogenes]|nr:CidA/LrgA family protein [[Pasteurella] aerogenes]MCI7719208.1 CidA/LrgA family protein [[Pasteurella] aerogenes]MCU9997804.1 CidA/LrgA family protein [[Pasteurella] aerogenes]MDY2797326.1 CidA/LrgA family protein [[Pasteurella] aerogenes]MDY4480184.1 CidA/LrgA family protein [[Pasteurella] aerogenes]
MLQKIMQLGRSFAILYLILFLGNYIAVLLPVGVPGSIWGLLLLFFGLITKLIKYQWIFLGASLLIRYMALLFIPVSVGIIKYSDLLLAQANVLLIPNIISTCVTLVIIALLGNYLFSLNSFTHLRKKVLKKRAEGIG